LKFKQEKFRSKFSAENHAMKSLFGKKSTRFWKPLGLSSFGAVSWVASGIDRLGFFFPESSVLPLWFADLEVLFSYTLCIYILNSSAPFYANLA